MQKSKWNIIALHLPFASPQHVLCQLEVELLAEGNDFNGAVKVMLAMSKGERYDAHLGRPGGRLYILVF